MGLEFVFLGGNLAVDFVNTVVVEGSAPVDRLQSDRDLLSWARSAGLSVNAAALKSASCKALDPATRPLRTCLRQLFLSCVDGKPPPKRSLALLNARLRAASPGASLSYKRGAFVREFTPLTCSTNVLDRVAESAATLLSVPGGPQLGACAHDRCVLLFLDRSRGRRRRWCSMNLCGNRSKAAAFARRTRGEA